MGSKGFTLVEVIVVGVIVAVLSAVAIPQYVNYVRDSRCKAVRNWANTAAAAAADYQAEYGAVPTWAQIKSEPSAEMQEWTDVGTAILSNGLIVTPKTNYCGAGCTAITISW